MAESRAPGTGATCHFGGWVVLVLTLLTYPRATPITDRSGAETIGIIIKPSAAAVRERGVKTLGELYGLLKDDISRALKDKPAT